MAEMVEPVKHYRGKKISRVDCKWAEWKFVTMKDDDFEEWAICRKCHEPLHLPKTLPCLHTVCYRCLQIHYSLERKQVKHREKSSPTKYNFMSFNGCFTCPVCAFPCYTLTSKMTHFPTNWRLIALTYSERLTRLRELDMVKAKETLKLTAKADKRAKNIPNSTPSTPTSTDGARPDVFNNSHDDDAESEQGQILSRFVMTSPQKRVPLSISDALSKHEDYARKECRTGLEDFLGEREHVWPADAPLHPTLPEYGHAHLCGEYGLEWGDGDFYIHAPSALAFNPTTGHVVVVDSSLDKALLFKKDIKKPWAFKRFFYPVMDVCFYPSGFAAASRENGYDRSPPNHKHAVHDDKEAFCAMGRNLTSQGVVIYRVPFTKNPLEYTNPLQNGVRDVSGLLLLPEGRMLISLGYNNLVLIQLVNPIVRPGEESEWTPKFFDLATRHSHGLCNPTHLIQGGPGQMILSDTNNHRIAVFYGPDYMASDFYCEFGHGKGQLFYPLGMAMDSHRHLFICDAGNHRVQVLNRSFRWHGFPIRATYRMGQSVLQDVKPIDCEIDPKDRLLVLFKGREFVSLQIFNYQGPLIATNDELSLPEPVIEDSDVCDCSCCFSSCFGCCCASRSHAGYQAIN